MLGSGPVPAVLAARAWMAGPGVVDERVRRGRTHWRTSNATARFARQLDVELRVACSTEATSRHELGIAARELLERRAYRSLGFVRVVDYARERLGIAARTLQSAAWVAARLESLPLVESAFDRSELSWAQVRALCAVARAGDQERWLRRARDSTVDELERLAAATRAAASPRCDGAIDADPDAEDGTVDGEPTMKVRISAPARVRALWRCAVDLASRVAGGPLAAWRGVEFIAAEAFSGRPPGASFVGRSSAPWPHPRRAGHRRAKSPDASGAEPSSYEATGPGAGDNSVVATHTVGDDRVAGTPEPNDHADAFALDARLVAAMHAIRTSEPRIGRLLRLVVDQRVHRAQGFASFAEYVRERLGISVRKAWALLKVERSARRGDEFAHAWNTGAISWSQALTLLPVVDRNNAAAWVARADTVTVRRLADEVSYVLESHDLSGGTSRLDPPPLDSPLPTLAASLEVQIRAQRRWHDSLRPRAATEVCDAEIAFMAPVSVVALFRGALDVFSIPGAPRWLALERVLRHVITQWLSMPPHPDPIFARDGWRCTVPGCTSRRNLHDHHLHYRSRGGGNEQTNRTAVCVAHHLHGIHAGRIRAWGTAPQPIYWELGVRSTAPPLLTYVGDRRCAPLTAIGADMNNLFTTSVRV